MFYSVIHRDTVWPCEFHTWTLKVQPVHPITGTVILDLITCLVALSVNIYYKTSLTLLLALLCLLQEWPGAGWRADCSALLKTGLSDLPQPKDYRGREEQEALDCRMFPGKLLFINERLHRQTLTHTHLPSVIKTILNVVSGGQKTRQAVFNRQVEVEQAGHCQLTNPVVLILRLVDFFKLFYGSGNKTHSHREM